MLGAFLGTGAGAAATYWYLRRQQPASSGTTALVDVSGVSAAALVAHPAMRHGAPVGDRLRVFSNFVLQFDTRMRNPR